MLVLRQRSFISDVGASSKKTPGFFKFVICDCFNYSSLDLGSITSRCSGERRKSSLVLTVILHFYFDIKIFVLFNSATVVLKFPLT